MTNPPLSSLDPNLIDPDIQAILNKLASTGAWSSYDGPYTQSLSEALKYRFQRTYSQLCCSGTLAVELALRGCRIQSGDEVLLAAYDFPGNFRAIEAIGATVGIVDIPSNSWSLLDTSQLELAVGPKTRAVVVSHLHGTLAPMKAICEWARSRELMVVEDACQVPGATIDGRPAGSWGDCSVLSFGGSKLLSAGRGGAILTNDARIDQRIRIFRERGNDAFALSELQAAVIGPQLVKLDSRHAGRAAMVLELERMINPLKWIGSPTRSEPIPNIAYYKWGFRVATSRVAVGVLRDAVIAALYDQGILAGSGFHGFGGRSSTRCRRLGATPNADNAALATILIHHTMLDHDLTKHFFDLDRRLQHANLIDQ